MKKWDDFKFFNRMRFCNRALQIVLLLMLIIGIVLLLPYIHLRWDLSQQRSNSLHNESRAFLKTLTDPLAIYMLGDESQPTEDFIATFKIYLHEIAGLFSQTHPLTFKMVHVLRDPKQTLQLKKQYKFDANTGVLVVLGEQSILIPFEDFYKAKRLACESCLMNAIYKISMPPKKIYWVTGHCELSGENVHPTQGGSSALQLLQQLHCDIGYLNTCHTIPEDADAVVIFGPQIPFFSEECEGLKQYLFQRHGHIWICLQPVYEHGLNPFLKTLGVACDSDLLLDNSKDYVGNDGNIIIRRYNPHPITQTLIDKKLGLLFGLSSTLRILNPDNHIQNLIFSSETSWNKPATYIKTLPFNSKTDTHGPHVLGLMFHSYLSSHFQSDFPMGKAAIIACTDWMNNAHIGILGNRYFFQNIYHTLEEDNAMAFFDTEVSEQPTQLIISRHHFLSLILLFLMFPFVLLLMGFITLILRKN